MSIIAAYNEAWENGDAEALAAIIHDDCVFNPHVGGITFSKSDILGFASGEGTPKSEANRILFENSEVGVAHAIVHFANGSCDLKTDRLSPWRLGQHHSLMITN